MLNGEIFMEYVILNNGLKVPLIAFGPGMITANFKIHRGSHIWDRIIRKVELHLFGNPRYRNGIDAAIKNGFRFVDYSAAYGNEDIVGSVIRKSGIDRNEFVVTTRISNVAQRNHLQKEEFLRSLERFGLDYVDLLMFHWPVTDCFIETYREMEDFYRQGLCKAIGVANCHQHHLKKILEMATVKPAIDQFEVHPLFTQKELIGFCKQENIAVQAYTPIARFDDRLMRLPALKKIATAHNKTSVQVVLRWHIQNGVIPVIRSLNANRQAENLNVFDFELTLAEMAIIDGFNINSRLRYDPDNCDFSIL